MRFYLLLPFVLSPLIASDLASLLPSAKANLRVEAVRLESQKTQEQLKQAKTAYFPTIDATALYQRKDKATAFEPKTIQGLEIGTRFTVFDGFKRESTLDALHSSIDSANHTLAQEEQTVLLETIIAYYEFFNARSRLDALKEKKNELSAQVERYTVLVRNGLATNDILSSLIASKLEADYNEEEQKVSLEQSLKNLELLSGDTVDTLEYKELKDPQSDQIRREDLMADRSMIEALRYSEGFHTYLPTLSVQGKHREMNYNDYDTMGGANIQPESQNEIIASLSMTLFDMGSIAKEKEQSRLSTLKAQKQIEYKTKQLQNDADIAQMRLKAARTSYDAAKAEEAARIEAFRYVKTRFEAGLVNTTTFLTELTNLSQSRGKVQISRDALQVAKAKLAYAFGTDLMTLLEENK